MPETLSPTRETDGFGFHALGGMGRIRIALSQRSQAESIVAECVRWLRETESQLSRFRPESLVSRLNRDGFCHADATLQSLLVLGEQARIQTQGRLHPAAAPLWNLWHDPNRNVWPNRGEIEAVRMQCEPGGLTCDGTEVRIREGMAIDLGGIAKEWCVDQIVTRLWAAGLCDFLVELAGDVAARGSQPGHRGWWILLPDGHHAYLLRDAALATSGHHRRGRWLGGRRVSHLLDAATGLPASGEVVTATLLAQTCVEAGISATDAALSASSNEALERIGKHQALLLFADRTTRATQAFVDASAEITSSPPSFR